MVRCFGEAGDVERGGAASGDGALAFAHAEDGWGCRKPQGHDVAEHKPANERRFHVLLPVFVGS